MADPINIPAERGPWTVAGRLGFATLIDPNIATCYDGDTAVGVKNAMLAAASVDIKATLAAALDELERERAEHERLRALVNGALSAIDTGRNEPLMAWRDHARAALNGEGEA